MRISENSSSSRVPSTPSIFEQVVHKFALVALYLLKGALYVFSLGRVHSISRSSIPPSTAPIPPETIVTHALSSVMSKKKLKEALNKWVSEGTSEEKRQEAADTILACFLQKKDRLILSDLELQSLPSCIGNLDQLQILHLNDNQLSSIPDSLGNLAQLQSLYLNNNQLSSIPDSLGKLIQLNTLGLNDNQLTSIPKSLGNLAQLKNLYLDNNQLSSVPLEILQLPRNCEVYLQNNPLSAEVLSQLRATRDTGPYFYLSRH